MGLNSKLLSKVYFNKYHMIWLPKVTLNLSSSPALVKEVEAALALAAEWRSLVTTGDEDYKWGID